MSKKLLIVDDQEIERTALASILAVEPGWEVRQTADGHEALDLLCTGFRPELCIVDLQMPRIDGMEFLRRVRRDRDLRALKVVVASATRNRDTIVELAKLSIDGYLLKPFVAEKILATLRPILAALPDPDAEPAVLRDLLTKTALVVDDDPVARAALGDVIKQEQHWRVIEVADGPAMMRQLEAGLRPDLSFVDLQMPDVDGLALISNLRRDSRLQGLRVAVISGQRDRDKIVALAQLKIDTYLLKPLDGTKVRAALRACV